MNFKYYKSLFKCPSVRYAIIFPKSCFKNLKSCKSFEVETLIKGKHREIVISGYEYDNFFDSTEKVETFFDKIWNLPIFNCSTKFISFTNVFKEDLNFIICGKETYSLYMFKKWEEFINVLKSSLSDFTYCSYIDIADFYKNIYIHFIACLGCNDVTSLRKLETRKGLYFRSYSEEYKWLNDCHKEIVNKICIYRQTCGLPIGNGLSDAISELILLWIDKNIDNIFVQDDFKLIRYRDDVYIFSNNKTQLQQINFKYKSIMSALRINQNMEKSIDIIKCNKMNFSSKWYEHEDKYKNEIIKEKIDSSIILKFAQKFPKSNKIYSLFQKYFNSRQTDKNIVMNFVELFNISKTNIIPWIIMILDRKLSIKDYQLFINGINQNLLTESDKIWLWCYEKKNNFCSSLHHIFQETINDKGLNEFFSNEHIVLIKILIHSILIITAKKFSARS